MGSLFSSIDRSIQSSIARPMKVGLGALGSAAAWSPLDIASCRLLLDASDMSTLFTDTGATTAVTASGQTVKAWRDKTANATLFTEATNAPTYTEAGGLKYLVFNGSTHRLAASLDLSAINALTVCAAVRRLAAADMTVINQNGTGLPSFTMDLGSTGTTLKTSSGGSANVRSATMAISAQPATDIMTGYFRISSALSQPRLNGVNGTPATTGQGSGNYQNGTTRIGLTTSSARPWNGNIYALALFTTILSEEDTDIVESWLAARAGVTL